MQCVNELVQSAAALAPFMDAHHASGLLNAAGALGAANQAHLYALLFRCAEFAVAANAGAPGAAAAWEPVNAYLALNGAAKLGAAGLVLPAQVLCLLV